MLSAKLFGPGDIRLTECPVPEIGEEDVLIKTKAAAICGSDLRMIANGCSGVDQNHPLTLGHEISGVVCRIGTRVEGYRVGMRVAVAPNFGCGVCDRCISGDTHLCGEYQALGININGGFAEYVRVPAKAIRQGNLILLPDRLSWEEAAVLEPMSCVLNGQERLSVQSGDRVVVIGAGPIGVMHAALARASGAAVVYICDSAEERRRQCCCLLPGCVPLEGELAGAIREKTNEEGVDVCIVACASPTVQAQALSLMAVNGRILYFGGLPAGFDSVALSTNLIHYKQLTICGSTRANLRQYRTAMAMTAAGTLPLAALVTGRFPLSQWQAALAEANGGRGMKTVITFE